MKTTKLFSSWVFGILLFAFSINANANNVQITGTTVVGSNITFDIAWNNSWNASVAPANWDAVWVFIKYQDCNTKLWSHVNLNVAGHSTVSPLQVDTVNDNKGVFIRRSAVGGGNISATSVTLSMNLPAGTYNFKVFGIEMVNVPQGAFQLGDGLSDFKFNSITIDAVAQANGLTQAQLETSYAIALPNTFPMGFNAFYCMKYEISQEQYSDFLNTLTFTQQKNHVVTDPISAAGSYAMYTGFQYRNGLSIVTPGFNGAIPAIFGCDATTGTPNGINDGQNIAMNNIGYLDLSAYLDWSALRPMTELEFEKTCRGPEARIVGAFPWGSTDITAASSSLLNNAFLASETSSTTVNNGMCVYNTANVGTTFGPLRVGALATGASGRLSSGAAYYGAMDMGGNLWERVIGAYNAGSSAFNGTLGDGELTSTGFSNAATLPTTDSNIVGGRGGEYNGAAALVRTSDRTYIVNGLSGRQFTYGGRGVR